MKKNQLIKNDNIKNFKSTDYLVNDWIVFTYNNKNCIGIITLMNNDRFINYITECGTLGIINEEEINNQIVIGVNTNKLFNSLKNRIVNQQINLITFKYFKNINYN